VKGTYLYFPLIACFGRIDRINRSSIDFGVVGPTRASTVTKQSQASAGKGRI
jgi:hypothetical protein